MPSISRTFAFRKRMPPEFSNQPIKLSIRDRRQWRRKFVFFVLSHARVLPLT
jgi:hypothetical protein